MKAMKIMQAQAEMDAMESKPNAKHKDKRVRNRVDKRKRKRNRSDKRERTRQDKRKRTRDDKKRKRSREEKKRAMKGRIKKHGWEKSNDLRTTMKKEQKEWDDCDLFNIDDDEEEVKKMAQARAEGFSLGYASAVGDIVRGNGLSFNKKAVERWAAAGRM